MRRRGDERQAQAISTFVAQERARLIGIK